MIWKLFSSKTKEQEEPQEKSRFFQKLKAGLSRTGRHLVGRIRSVLSHRSVDEGLVQEIEKILITSDVGVKATHKILAAVKDRVRALGVQEGEALEILLKEEIQRLLHDRSDTPLPANGSIPTVIFFVGVNGVGKTTSLGKIAHMFQRQGKKTMLVAADTFRAAAVEQLNVWSQRTGAELIKNPQGRDPGAVLFDALRAAKTRGTEVVLVDTAGRLHTKVNLMEELKKLVRIAGREVPGAPHEVFLVVDASTGQNALQQAKIFQQNIRPTGIILTKLDGTAKGGVIIGIYEELGIPVRFVGMGEREDDLEEFDADQFVEAMFEAGTG